MAINHEKERQLYENIKYYEKRLMEKTQPMIAENKETLVLPTIELEEKLKRIENKIKYNKSLLNLDKLKNQRDENKELIRLNSKNLIDYKQEISSKKSELETKLENTTNKDKKKLIDKEISEYKEEYESFGKIIGVLNQFNAINSSKSKEISEGNSEALEDFEKKHKGLLGEPKEEGREHMYRTNSYFLFNDNFGKKVKYYDYDNETKVGVVDNNGRNHTVHHTDGNTQSKDVANFVILENFEHDYYHDMLREYRNVFEKINLLKKKLNFYENNKNCIQDDPREKLVNRFKKVILKRSFKKVILDDIEYIRKIVCSEKFVPEDIILSAIERNEAKINNRLKNFNEEQELKNFEKFKEFVDSKICYLEKYLRDHGFMNDEGELQKPGEGANKKTQQVYEERSKEYQDYIEIGGTLKKYKEKESKLNYIKTRLEEEKNKFKTYKEKAALRKTAQENIKIKASETLIQTIKDFENVLKPLGINVNL